ncbi:1-phosphofructokinase family hexose kinase [Candidatus Gracilibacteria bacterium]|nr:1-phosphofructokinase family hexose kinase [Candidatus Gracilibacteria bacterium]
MTLIIVMPNPALDRTMVIRNAQLGAVLRAERVLVRAGGKGLNVARAARTLSQEALVCAPLGGHSGRWFAQLAEAEGIVGRWSAIESETRSCVLLVDPAGNDATALNERGPELSAAEWEAFGAGIVLLTATERRTENKGTKEQTSQQVQGAERSAVLANSASENPAFSAPSAVQNAELHLVALCGSLPQGVAPERYGELVQLVQSQGFLAIVDTSGAALHAAFAARPWAIKVNARELGELLGRDITTVETAAAALEELRASGVAIAAVTLGAQGALALDDTGCWWASPPPIELVSSIGSGDSLLAGLCSGLLRGQSLPEALRLGVACGSADALTIGGGLIEMATVERLAAATQVVPFC